MNTWGIRSINVTTFNHGFDSVYKYPKESRDVLTTCLRAHNLTFNILGYIPGICKVSGCVRMASGVGMVLSTMGFEDRNPTGREMIGRWYDEAFATGISQIARGALEAFTPFGWIVNFSLDGICTVSNIKKESYAQSIEKCQSHGSPPHEDPPYPFWFSFLSLV